MTGKMFSGRRLFSSRRLFRYHAAERFDRLSRRVDDLRVAPALYGAYRQCTPPNNRFIRLELGREAFAYFGRRGVYAAVSSLLMPRGAAQPPPRFPPRHATSRALFSLRAAMPLVETRACVSPCLRGRKTRPHRLRAAPRRRDHGRRGAAMPTSLLLRKIRRRRDEPALSALI